jgi:hypothetical protein
MRFAEIALGALLILKRAIDFYQRASPSPTR